MSDYREESIRRKNVQRGIEDERPVGGKKKVGRKPYLIESMWFKEWHWSGRYTSLETAQQAFAQKKRKHPKTGWRITLDGQVLETYAYGVMGIDVETFCTNTPTGERAKD